ncbi:MAG: hypothetical protein J1F63_01545 [Oscillospiraceae bacterium]|nr:hypothetical protein [Oscillospiraceae bacterium]
MVNYEKPLVFENEELAEGVYAASGSTGGGANPGAGGVYVLGVSLISEGNQYNKVNIYEVTIKNDGSTEQTDWTVHLMVTSGTAVGAQVYNGYLASASLNGNTITVKPGAGGAVPAEGSITVEVVVSYSSNSITVA